MRTWFTFDGVRKHWQPQCAGLLPVVTRMLKAEDVFQLDLSRQVVIWQPSTSEFSRICCAVEFADQDRIRDLLWKSANQSLVSARKYYARNGARNANDYSAVRRQLLRSLKRAREQGLQSSHIAQWLEAFNHSFDKTVVEAIVKDAMATTDSVERSLLLAAVQSVTTFCSFLSEFSSFGFDSWAAVVIIE